MRLSLVYAAVVATMAAFVTAEPAVVQPVKRQTGTVSADLRREMTIAFQYSIAAVLPQIPGAPAECAVCNQLFLPQSKVLAYFINIVPSVRGFVGRDDANKRIVLGFSGTTDPVGALEDLDIIQQAWPTDVPGSKVHQGFLVSYQSAIGQFLPPLEKAMAGECKGYQLSVVGHSLGGAQAMIAAVDLKRRHPDWNINVFPSGKPRVGNEAWARYVNGLGMPIHRLIAKWDQVPRIPLRSWGYVHETGEVWLNQSGDWIQCDTFENGVGEDQSCADSVPFILTNWFDHVLSYPGTVIHPN